MDRVLAHATALLEEGKPLEAADLLAGKGRFGQAARMLMKDLGVEPDAVAALPLAKKRQASKAATYFVRANEEEMAAVIYAALGEKEKAAQLQAKADVRDEAATGTKSAEKLEKQGRFEEAARLYLKLGQRDAVARVARHLPPRTGALYLGQIGRYLEAARMCLDAGDKQTAYECLVRVPSTDPDYNDACRHLVSLVWPTRFLDTRLATFFSTWVQAAPSEEDFDALCKLAVLYGENGRIDDAREVYRRITAKAPHHAEAMAGLAILSGDAAADLPVLEPAAETSRVFARVNKTDMQIVSEEATQDNLLRGALAERVRELRADTRIGGRYRLIKKLGGGGMGVVFEAQDEELGEKVALKFLLPLDDTNALARFKREIALTRRLSHQNVVRVFDLGIFEDIRYVTMELLRGEDLARKMRKPIELLLALDILAQTCRGLDAAHREGIIHRDVKPANIFITNAAGIVKVMDFGVARESTSNTGMTQTGVLLGTPRYMAPEYFLGGKALRPSADLYAVGVTAYEVFTGEPPFTADSPMPLLMKHVNDDPVPPIVKNPDVPAPLNDLILRLLAKAPEKRPGSAADVVDELERVRAWVTLNGPTRAEDELQDEMLFD